MVIRQYKAISAPIWRGYFFVSEWESCPEVTQDILVTPLIFNDKMKKTILSILMLLIVVSTFAQTHRSYSNQGGRYKNGRGSSHKGGSYKNSRTGNHYTHHRR
jgi:hypothetical protein